MNSQTLQKIWAQVPPDYYFKLTIPQRLWHDRKWQVISELLMHYEKTPKRILEVGCSAGHLCGLLSQLFPETEVVGIDVYKPAIVEARRRYPKLTFKVADAHALPFSAQSFDLVISSETIEHVVDPDKMLSEIKRVLKKDGLALIEMDSGSPLFRVIWFFWTKFGKGKVWQNAHLHPFKAAELETVIRTTPFVIVQKKFSHAGMAVSFLVKK